MQPPERGDAERQVEVNEALWGEGDLLADYAGRTLRPVEVMLLVRHREELSGRVLELGCGGGRLSGYLIELAREFRGLDISPRMVAHCRGMYPSGRFEVRDLRDLAGYESGGFDAVLAPFNVLDVLDNAERLRVLGELRRILSARGLLVFSTHNLAFAPSIPRPTHVRRDPLRGAADLLRMPRRLRNHRRLRGLQRREDDHAVLIDEAHDYSILHYYIGRDAQERQLAGRGLRLLACLDLDGRPVARGEQAPHAPELHYVAVAAPGGSDMRP